MITIKIIVTSIFLSFYIIEQTRLPEKLKINYKPFNCFICLPFYLSAILYFLSAFYLNLILVSTISAVISPYFRNFMINLFHNQKFQTK